MSTTENIPCDSVATEELRKLVKKKYGKLKGVFNIEITAGVKLQCDVIRKELDDQSGKTDSQEKKLDVVELERIENLDDSLEEVIDGLGV